jgi:hypothetical protein
MPANRRNGRSALALLLLVPAAAVAAPWARAHEDALSLFPRSGAPRVEGTTWSGTDGDGPMTFTFEPGGVLRYTYQAGTFRNGTWKQTGRSVYIEMNNKFAERRGTLRGNRLTGDAWNVQGLKWSFDVSRK